MANGFATATAEIAVVVQQLVHSDVSFVAFTTDPIRDRDDHLVITATWGLGESIVSGLVVPDQVVVGPDGSILDYTIGGKHLMVIPGSGADEGTREVAVPRVLQSVPVLSREQITAIATMARSLSSRLGYEADLEGGFAEGSLYLFQARPITTIAAQPPAVSMRWEEQLSVSRQ
jgi:pyruvate,water dikinase